ncbi:nephrocystin-3 isoform X4 [Prunus dulcis]|uniref:nephrocystin-3 isoform X4 n=1 Tax=Prunus dulcis TaxID=3755 RepID=UPI001483478D|nr:nephrocystin-3 isoform X4 [Prunus dulcis]
MAASLLLPSPFFNNCGISKGCLHHIQSGYFHKGLTFFSGCLPKKNSSIFMVPVRAFALCCYASRTFASVGSLDTDVAGRESHVSNSNNFQTSVTSFQHSSDKLDGMKDFERELQELFDEVKMMIMMGNQNDAIDLLQANYEAVKERMNAGVRGIEEAATIDIIALGYMAIGDVKFVNALLDMLNEVVDSLKDDEPLLDSVLVHMGSMYSTLGKFEKSMSAYRRAIGNMEHIYGDANEAISLYRKALQVITTSNYMALDDSIMEKMRIDLAELLHAVGRGKEGRELLEQCLMITEKYKGKEDPSSATHLINLATSHSRSKNYVEAERLLRTSLEIMGRTVGPDDQSITFPMLHLAVTLYHLKRDEEAEQLALEALHIREKAFGKDSLPVAEALDCLVSIQTRLKKDDEELLEQLTRVLSIQEREFGPEGEEVMITLKKVVFYLDKLGRKNEIFPLQKRLSALGMKFKQRIQH